ncbi:MAG: BamA/TamA family outer membrane protein, partial [Cystobacter sp.]
HGPVFQFSAQFEQPRFLARDLRLQTTLSAERGLEQAYNFIGGRLRGGVVWQPRPDFSIFPTYNLELYNLKGQRGSVDQTTAPTLVLGCPDAVDGGDCNISVSYLEQFIELNRRDDPLAPRHGFYASLSLQEGGGILQGNYDFVRVLPDLRGYYTFGPRERLTLAARLRMGTLLTFSNSESAIVNRFFAGGGASMRGFNARRLAPMSQIRTTPDSSTDANVNPVDTIVPIGGNSLVETSVELRVKLFSELTLALFHDSGLTGYGPLTFGARKDDLLLESGRLFGDNHYQAVGFGLRYNTIVGPIRVDVARRLNIGQPLPILGSSASEATTLDGWGDCFGLGIKKEDGVNVKRRYAGAPEGLCTFFLSIGEAF